MEHTQKNIPMIMIEGNVGVGKSTFLSYLKKHLDADIIYEPNELWQNLDGHNLLEQFFLEPRRWAFTCQSYILFTRIDQFFAELSQAKHPLCLVERSVYSGRYCFAQVAQEIGWMDPMEGILYQKLWDREIARLQHPPAAFIYLRTSAQICYERIMQRGRFEEKPITLDYLKRIEEKYENWFIHKQGVDEKILNLPVLVLDFSHNLSDDAALQEHASEKIKNFLAQIL
jgi:deoxyadenosine/deoxycytidine kinase